MGLYTVSVVALRGQKRTSDLLERPGVTDGYEPPHVGAGDRIWVLCKAVHAINWGTITLQLSQ